MSIHWFPGHMAKTRRQIEEKLKLIDIVIELVDARIPYSCKNSMLDKLVENKKRIIVMTKIDLADPIMTKQFIKYYESLNFKVVTTNLNDFKELNSIVARASEELKEKFEKDARRGIKPRAIRALIVGIPNVGKSTLINRISKRKAAKTGDKAGVTKALQWIKVNKDFELLDSPGILWPRFDDKQVAINLALTGAIKEEILPKEDLCFIALRFLNEYYPQDLYKRYPVINFDNDDINSIVLFLDELAQHRMCYLRNKEVDYDKLYDIILKEFKSGTIARITLDREFIS